MNSKQTLEQAWRKLVQDILSNGEAVAGVTDKMSVGSHFGTARRAYRELLCTVVRIEKPRRRIVLSPCRKFRLGAAIAHAIWAFSGSNSLDPISFYIPRGRAFSDDGLRFNAAIGHRIFCSAGNQFQAALERLRIDRTSRRAVIDVFQNDGLTNSRDISCTLSIQFLIRGTKLHAIVTMRSQSVLMVCPYDLFFISMLLDVMAVELRLHVGSIIHVCNSAHIYEDELGLAQRVMSESPSNAAAMDGVPVGFLSTIPQVFELEAMLRERLQEGRDYQDLIASATDYWRPLLQVLAAEYCLSQGEDVPQRVLLSLPDEFQTALSFINKSEAVPG
jgi:hypothetical protein